MADGLHAIEIDLPGVSLDRTFKDDVRVVYDQLEHQLAESSAIYCYWAMVFSEYKLHVNALKLKIARMRAIIIKELLDKNKRLRRSDIEELVYNNEDLVEEETHLILANKNLGKLGMVLNALKMKDANLRSLAMFKRHER